MKINNSTNVYSNSRYVVGLGSPYTTIQSAIGITGYLASTLAKDNVRITCVTAGASAEWVVASSIGNITYA